MFLRPTTHLLNTHRRGNELLEYAKKNVLILTFLLSLPKLTGHMKLDTNSCHFQVWCVLPRKQPDEATKPKDSINDNQRKSLLRMTSNQGKTHPQACVGDEVTNRYPLLRWLRLPQLCTFSCRRVHRLKWRQNCNDVIYEELRITRKRAD